MSATLGRTATGYTIANVMKYDVWGAVRDSQSPGSHVVNPNKQYCANLGHTFDGESDLIYMRARYYEPNSGRFISEDPAGDGKNWYIYCKNRPTVATDPSGFMSDAQFFLVVAVLSIPLSFNKEFFKTLNKIARRPMGTVMLIVRMSLIGALTTGDDAVNDSHAHKMWTGFILHAASSLLVIACLAALDYANYEPRSSVAANMAAGWSAYILTLALGIAILFIEGEANEWSSNLQEQQ